MEFITPLHQRQNVDRFKKVKEHRPDDYLVELPLTKKHLTRDPGLPREVRRRVTQPELKRPGSTAFLKSMNSGMRHNYCVF